MVIHAFIFINQRMGKKDPSLQNTTIGHVAPGPVRKKLSSYQDCDCYQNAIYSCSPRTTGNLEHITSISLIFFGAIILPALLKSYFLTLKSSKKSTIRD